MYLQRNAFDMHGCHCGLIHRPAAPHASRERNEIDVGMLDGESGERRGEVEDLEYIVGDSSAVEGVCETFGCEGCLR